ncbi:MAG: RagB/SusD family nutrient uptake outer membrane protein, partial [Bacteroidales bacterium]|nr:RagB/SusD family nutrient uptake outer membrane protein [Bacteroidales bacterium]
MVLSKGTSITQTTTNIWYNDSLGRIAETGGWGFLLPTVDLVNEFEVGDPRFSTIVGQEGDSVMVGQKWYTLSLTNSITGYCCRKYETGYNEFWGVKQEWSNSPLNFRLIRYADVVLIAAEAALESGDNAKALEYINQVRTRARNCGNTGVPADLTGTVTLDDLMHERRIELAMEGDRFFDLVRWKMAGQKLNGSMLSIDIPVQYESPKYDFFPIPVS